MKKPLALFLSLCAAIAGIAAGAGITTQGGSRHYVASSSSSSSSSGGLSDGGNAHITGTGFDTNSATIYSLKDVVEANSAGTNWQSMSGIPGTWSHPGGLQTVVSTTGELYGTKALVSNGTGTDGVFGVALDTGGTISAIFWRDYVRIDKIAGNPTTGQWKWFRINADGIITDDHLAGCYAGDWFGSGFDFWVCNRTSQQKDDPPWGTDWATWYERECYLQSPSGTGVSDGIVQCRVRRVSDGVEVANADWTDINAFNNADRWRYLVFYNYQGNPNFNDGTNNTGVIQDGVYIQNGGRQRLYLSQTATWAAIIATNGALKEIQEPQTSPTGWGSDWTDTRIDFKVRQGVLASLSPIYAYVVAADGSVNANGYTVTAD